MRQEEAEMEMASASRGRQTHNRHAQNDSTSQVVAQSVVDSSSPSCGKSFNFTEFIGCKENAFSDTQISTDIQRRGLIQPFGCLIAIDERTLKIIAYSENAIEMLDLTTQSISSIETRPLLTTGTDVRSLFTPSSTVLLEKAVRTREITLFNPIYLHSVNSGKSFYAILHRIDVGIIMDLEPGNIKEPALPISGAAQAQRLAVGEISRLQGLPAGDVNLLWDTVAGRVREITGYDRVMVFMFHEDEHVEVVSESKRSDLEPCLGLHYPASYIPQSSRFLFRQSRVQIICDCHAKPVGIIQDEALVQPLCLAGSTLRAPDKCLAQYTATMGAVASLVLAIIITEDDRDVGCSSGRRGLMKLWGLVVCHHTAPRCTPFPLRYACEFLMQAFGLQLNMELQLASQLSERRVLKTQTLLCEMLLRGSPSEIVMKSPNIMDLVKCDGAALCHKGKYYPLGVAPTEAQIHDIMKWVLASHGDSAGLSTDSLADAGYPGAAALSDAVCGMAVVSITKNDFIFWFRSPITKKIRWGGSRHNFEDTDGEQIMRPRSSFIAFLEVVKGRSLPWENSEMDAIYSLRLILRDSFQDAEECKSEVLDYATHFSRLEVEGVDELCSVAREMVRLIETATAPIFAVDSTGKISGWNAKVAELTGLSVEKAMGKSLIYDLVYTESSEVVRNLLSRALRGEEDRNVEIKLKTFRPQQKLDAVFLVVNACSSKDYLSRIIGVCFVGQDVTEQKVVLDKFKLIQGDYKAIIQSPNPLIPPIFASDENLCCSEWNTAMEKITGWTRYEMIEKLLIGDVFGSCCRFRSQDDLTKFMILLNNALNGQDADKLKFSFFNRNGTYIQALLSAYKRVDVDGKIIGVFCFLQIASPELQQILEIQRQQEKYCSAKMKELTYLCQEINNPLGGIRFVNLLLEATNLSDNQKQLLETSVACERQMTKVMNDLDPDSIEDGSLKLDKVVFLLGNVISAVVSQVMILLRERGLQLIRDIPEDVKTMSLYGDQFIIQQILSDFLSSIVRYAPSPDGWVEIQIKTSLKHNIKGMECVNLEIRMISPGVGLPAVLVQDVFHNTHCVSQESLGLSVCRKLLKLMNGEVHYMIECDRYFFLILMELPISESATNGSN